MRLEIERKFLVTDASWSASVIEATALRDGVISVSAGGKVRVRLDAMTAWLTVKGPRAGISRREFEYEIPREDAELLLASHCCGHPVEKVRHRVPYAGLVWQVDVYGGALEGIVLAEVELDSEAQAFERPPWVGAEVSMDPRYRQSMLLRRAQEAVPEPDVGPHQVVFAL
ncbi:CYTH domain-containing protein [Methylobacterium brachiatum]